MFSRLRKETKGETEKTLMSSKKNILHRNQLYDDRIDY